MFNINNGLDIAEQNRQRNENILEDDDLIDESFKVIYAGSIRPANSIDTIVKALELLRQHDDIKMLVYGDGDSKEKIKEYCDKNGLDHVVFKNRVHSKHIPYICSKASVNIISVKETRISKYGVSWNKLFDYMNAGKPILSTVKPNYDLLERYQCGMSLSEQTPQAIADAILQIYNMPKEKYNKMCENAKNAAKDFDYSILTDKLEEAINYAIEHHGEKK